MIRSLRSGVTEDCEPSSTCLRLKPEPLEEQPLLLTTELSISPAPTVTVLKQCSVLFSFHMVHYVNAYVHTHK